MFEPAEWVVPPEGSVSPDSDILEQEAQQKEETQPSPESDRALPTEAIKPETSEPDSFGELPRAEEPVEVESTRIDQNPEEVREIKTAQESAPAQDNSSEEAASVVLTPEHIETPRGSSPLTDTGVKAMGKRQEARQRLARRPSMGVEGEAA